MAKILNYSSRNYKTYKTYQDAIKAIAKFEEKYSDLMKENNHISAYWVMAHDEETGERFIPCFVNPTNILMFALINAKHAVIGEMRAN